MTGLVYFGMGEQLQKWLGPFRLVFTAKAPLLQSGNTKGGSITVPLTSCLTGMD